MRYFINSGPPCSSSDWNEQRRPFPFPLKSMIRANNWWPKAVIAITFEAATPFEKPKDILNEWTSGAPVAKLHDMAFVIFRNFR